MPSPPIRQSETCYPKHLDTRRKVSNRNISRRIDVCLLINESNLPKFQKIITTPHDITPEWISDLLGRIGIATNAQVQSVDVLMTKELQVSTVCRLGITYRNAAEKLYPRSLFLKLPRALSKEDRVPGASDDHAEVEFYTKVAPRIACPPLIRCYDAAYSNDCSHILLEDLTDTHSQPQQNHSPSMEQSFDAIKALAVAHAAWWGVANVAIPGRRESAFDIQTFIVNLHQSVTEFCRVARPTPQQMNAYRLMLESAHRIWGRLLREDHLTVTHGDTHWWNFLYPKASGENSVRIFDWHLWHRDLGARDLAFLLALGGFAEPRPQMEEQFLRVYHETLIANGVAGYTWVMLLEDYRWSAIRNLNIPVIFRSQQKHYSTWQTALRRAFAAYERLDCESLLVNH